MNSFFVYILYSEDHDRFYIGQTNDLMKRIKRHNSGYVRSTKAYKPWKIRWSKSVVDRAEAIKLESLIKSWKSRVKINALGNGDFQL